ncbi:DUF3883 domain-containing protein [Nocardiopsis sp. NPDC050513]|uniref:DUF3883 domain-containing protein n=1 Tax=Nocardiopsis sp. NPDC050513 TaxID=3364338 RepID=UPI0037A9A4CB
MTLLPRHGLVFGVLLLAHASQVPRVDVAAWVRAASERAGHWSRSLDLSTVARALLEHDLAEQTLDGIRPAPQLRALPAMDSSAMRAAARVLLAASPPVWLTQAVRSNAVVHDYIPDADLKALAWLEPGLDSLLVDVAVMHHSTQEDVWRKRVGEAAEAVVLSALRREGRLARQVSLVSPSYGYDIEIGNPPLERIEVKGAGPETSGSFHITRHEFETALRYPDTYSVVQVVFHSSAFSAEVLRGEHVAAVIRLASQVLCSIVPADTETFTWEQSALLRPPTIAWRPTALRPEEGFFVPGLR